MGKIIVRSTTKVNRTQNTLNFPQRIIVHVILFFSFIIMVFPLWNVFVVSTSTALDSSSSSIKLFWTNFSVEGYDYIFSQLNLWRYFFNSLYVSIVSVIAQVILCSLAGYVLIQRDLPGRKIITSFILLTMMIPGDITLISIYQLNRQLNLTNTFTGLIVNGIISGFAIMLMRNYFLSVPLSLGESARIEGASEYRIFFRIYLPLSLPGLSTVFFLEFVNRWNSLMIPAMLLTDSKKFTLPLILRTLVSPEAASGMSGGTIITENIAMAGVIVSTIPLVIVYIFAQRFLLAGMTLGAIKE